MIVIVVAAAGAGVVIAMIISIVIVAESSNSNRNRNRNSNSNSNSSSNSSCDCSKGGCPSGLPGILTTALEHDRPMCIEDHRGSYVVIRSKGVVPNGSIPTREYCSMPNTGGNSACRGRTCLRL